MATKRIRVFEKAIKLNKGTKFKTLFCKYGKDFSKSMSCYLTNNAKQSLILKGLKYPVEMELEDKVDYFITDKKDQAGKYILTKDGNKIPNLIVTHINPDTLSAVVFDDRLLED